MAITKDDILKKRVVTSQIKQAMEQPQSPGLQSVLRRTVQQQPVVTDRIRQQVEGTAPSTQQAQELQSIQDRTEQQMAKQKPVVTEQIKQAVENTTAAPTTAPTAEGDPYAFFENYIKSKQPTPEELEAERKREKRKAIFNAIGDGVSSLANLYFTTKGAPNSYNPADNMTAKQRERYEKLLAERKADEDKWLNAQMRLAQLRDSANWRKQQADYQKERDRIGDARYKEQQEAKDAALKAEADRWEREFKHKQDEAEKNRGMRQAEIDARNAHNAATLAETRRYHDQVAEARQGTTANKLRGKQLAFSDGADNQVVIYENVWKPSMQEVYNAIIADNVVELSALQKVEGMTATQKEDFVKTHWTKSPKARRLMLALSKIDPATMGSQVEEDDDYSQYEEVDYSQYEE